jgi:hypothetical protein
MTRLVRAHRENRLERTLQQLVYPKLLILDELGYLPLNREEASLFFRLLVRRYERASLVVTRTWSLKISPQSRKLLLLSPPPSSTGCSITPPPSTSRARATDSKEKRRAGLLTRAQAPESEEEVKVPEEPVTADR